MAQQFGQAKAAPRRSALDRPLGNTQTLRGLCDAEALDVERDHDGEDDDFESITELAIRDRLGFCYEGVYYPDDLDPATVPLLVYR